jgi:putative DNA methylase
MHSRKKLIEVALPLEVINQESAREKSIRHGHPSTLHLWWARRPLAACRAILFASLVDDPSSHPDRFLTEEAQNVERQRLFDLLGRIVTVEKRKKSEQVVRGLVSWDDIKDPAVVEAAQLEIARSLAWNRGEEPPIDPKDIQQYILEHSPIVYDPFAGGGSIPIEAQRLGLKACASDLNPVAVLITKALIEIPPKFAGQPPINPDHRNVDEVAKELKKSIWKGAKGLAEDIRYYGQWMREQAEKQIGHLYPTVKSPGGKDATVIAWIWARTVNCPNPACGCEMPLVRSFALSTKKGNEHWINPVIEHSQKPPQIRFEIKDSGTPPEGTVSRKGARCIACDSPVLLEYVRSQGKAGHMGEMLMAIVAEGEKGRLYLPPNAEHIKTAASAQPKWKPDTDLVLNSRHVTPHIYGMTKHADLFTARQLTALSTFSELVEKARVQLMQDGATQDYANAVATYLAFAVDKCTDYWSSLCTWHTSGEKMSHVFTRQAIPMTWDFAECCPFSDSSGNWTGCVTWIRKAVAEWQGSVPGEVWQMDARDIGTSGLKRIVLPTDPPYYDAVPYADLADFFYVWLRHSIGHLYPDLFKTLLTPKDQELVADPFRHGGKEQAKQYFENGLKEVFSEICKITHPDYPFTVQYAFKQAESDEEDDSSDNGKPSVASTGWETMLEALIQSGFCVTGTLPIRTELSNRMRGQGSNALASSIALVCRPRLDDAPKATRRQFLTILKQELPDALRKLQQGNIAPVDLAQATIGPGMAVFSRYKQVLESDGTPMRVRTALQLINQTLDEYLTEQEGEFDADTRWALTWFEQHQFTEGLFGDAETLSKAKVTSVKGLEDSGILLAKSGKVRLLRRDELPSQWNPDSDARIPIWEATQHLIRALDQQGETGASTLLAQLNGQGEVARDLAYRLYSICDRKGWTQEAIAYNSLVIAWAEISRLAAQYPVSKQIELLSV